MNKNTSTGLDDVEKVLNQSQFDGLSDTMKKQLVEMAEDEQTKFLNEVCGAGSGSGLSIGVVDGSYYDLPWDNFRDDYILKVESGNEFVNKLKQIEKKFFTSKYGERLYNHLLSKRDLYEDEIVQRIAEHYGIIRSSESSPSFDRSHAEVMENIDRQMQLNNALLSFKNTNVGEGITSALSYFEDELRSIYGENATNDRRVEYRGDEINKLSSWNRFFTLIYFIVFAMILVMKMLNKNLDLKANAVTYIIIILFPIIIFPITFSILYRIFMSSYRMIDVKKHGPKNAFLDNNV